MKLLVDLHTHSKFSRFGHGKSSIEEMVYRANELGLKELAITDHGYKHFFRTSKLKLINARKIIDEINTWSKTKVLLGIEADILNENGDLDIDEETLDLIDILVVGYHRMIKTNFAGFFGGQKNTTEAIEKATRAYLNAIDRYPINFISHIDSVLTTDLFRIGRACKENGILIEINNRHVNWTDRQVEELLSSDCNFIVSSDAHSSEDIGVADRAFNFIKKHKIPAENIFNVEFEEDELTAKDKEDRFYLNLYKQMHKNETSQEVEIPSVITETLKSYESETVIETIAPKNKTKSLLSKEMEDELEKIALEQGISGYHREDGNASISLQEYEQMKQGESEFKTELNALNSQTSTDNDEIIQEESSYSNEFNSNQTLNSKEPFEKQNNNILNSINRTENMENRVIDATKDTTKIVNNSEKKSYMSHIERTPVVSKDENNASQKNKIDENDELSNITNSLNQFKGNRNNSLNPNRYRDSDYEYRKTQEEQVEYIKSYSESQSTESGYGYGFEEENSNFFSDDFGSANFNVNSEVQRRQKSKQEIVNINSYSKNKQDNELNNSQNASVNQHSTNANRKSNGFVDFSNLTDDE